MREAHAHFKTRLESVSKQAAAPPGTFCASRVTHFADDHSFLVTGS